MSTSEVQGSTEETSKVYKLSCIDLTTMVAHFICVLFVGFMIYTAVPGSSLFSWHPTLMTVAFGLAMFQAILVFSPQSSLVASAPRKTKVFYHWLLMATAFACMLAGFAVIYYNKVLNDYPHFTSYHGKIGLAAIIGCFGAASGGIMAKTYPSFVAKTMPLRQLKAIHATAGLTVFGLVCASLGLGMNSSWFTKEVTGTAWYGCIVCPMLLALIVMKQVTTAYLGRAAL